MTKKEKQQTIHEKWEKDSKDGVGFTPNPDPTDKPIVIDERTNKA